MGRDSVQPSLTGLNTRAAASPRGSCFLGPTFLLSLPHKCYMRVLAVAY